MSIRSHRARKHPDPFQSLPAMRAAFVDGGVPLYEQVKRQISELILMGSWPPGMVLPGENRLAGELRVAVGTVRRALADLTAEGFLMRRRKTGTIVTGRSPHHSLRFFFQYFRLHGIHGELLRSEPEVVSLARGHASASEQEGLVLERNAKVIRMHRVRRIAGRSVMHGRMTLAAHRFPDFPRAEDLPPLLYLFFLERYGIRISAVRESLTAQLATEEDATLLSLTPPAAVLMINAIAYDQAGQATALAVHRAVTDCYCYMNEVR